MVQTEDQILLRMEDQSGACEFLLRATSDRSAAHSAMERAATAVFDVPHPYEPSGPLPNFASDVTETSDGPSFWIDCKDELEDPDTAAAVVAAIVGALDDAGVDGTLCVIKPDDADTD